MQCHDKLTNVLLTKTKLHSFIYLFIYYYNYESVSLIKKNYESISKKVSWKGDQKHSS